MQTSSQNQWSNSSSESEFSSISSPETTSPNQMFSPSHQTKPLCSKSVKTSNIMKKKRRLRLKNPSEQRQNASEKEKLRMRDLTKALHHLRSFLPASVAPVGQTLTKIETLRLTIRYISSLSSQLGLSEEELSYRRHESSSGCSLSSFECSSLGGGFVGTDQGYTRCDGQYEDCSGHGGQYEEQYGGFTQQHSMEQNDLVNIDGFIQTQQCGQMTQTLYQVYGRNFGYHLVPQAYWS